MARSHGHAMRRLVRLFVVEAASKPFLLVKLATAKQMATATPPSSPPSPCFPVAKSPSAADRPTQHDHRLCLTWIVSLAPQRKPPTIQLGSRISAAAHRSHDDAGRANGKCSEPCNGRWAIIHCQSQCDDVVSASTEEKGCCDVVGTCQETSPRQQAARIAQPDRATATRKD